MPRRRKMSGFEENESRKASQKTYKRTYSNQRRMERTKKDALKILKIKYGNISLTCEQVGVSRQTFYKWMHDDPEFNAEVEEINERTLDLVESKMLQGINEGNTRLIMFYLSCKGKKRGYGLKSENGNEKNNAVTLHITADEMEY